MAGLDIPEDLGLTKVKQLGEGAFGSVWLYKQHRGHAQQQQARDEEVAVKFIARDATTNYQNIQREVVCQATLTHPHIIGFKRLGLSRDQGHVFLMMEYADGGALHDYVKTRGALTEEHARWFFQQMVYALDYCHRRGVVNRDLKLENLLLSRLVRGDGVAVNPFNLLVKLADFGLSNEYVASMPKSTVGTLSHMAPEVLRAEPGKPYNAQADIWSLGVVLYVMLFRGYPFGTQANAELQADIEKANWRRPPEGQLSPSPSCLDLLDRIFVADPARRITLEGIMEHPWFKEQLQFDVRSCNGQRIAEQAAQRPCCAQSWEEIDAILHQARTAGTPYGNLYDNGEPLGVSDSAIDNEIDEEMDGVEPTVRGSVL